VADDTVALLATLGITRIGQLAALPRSALLARFGPELLRRFDQAIGRAPETIETRHAPPEYAADFTFEAPLANRAGVEQVLGQLIAQVTEPLSRRREGVLRLVCRLKYERAFEASTLPFRAGLLADPPDRDSSLAFTLGLFRPSASPEYLRDLLRLRLENVRMAGPVTRVHVEVTSVGPLELRQQAMFDSETKSDQPRRLAELVDRLSNRLGRGAVAQVALLPDAQPEYTCVDVPMAGHVTTKSPARNPVKNRTKKNLAHVSRYGLLSFAADERPLWLLPQPARIEVVAVTPSGAPGQFRWAGRSYSVAYAWGPERIETGWWRTARHDREDRKTFVRRDYYRVETTSGARFWIFRRLGDRQWFLQGRFD
jgi:protein ImuB